MKIIKFGGFEQMVANVREDSNKQEIRTKKEGGKAGATRKSRTMFLK